MRAIIELIGSPDEAFLEDIDDADNAKFMRELPSCKQSDLSKKIPGASAECLDLISKMLVMDPFKRISCIDALNHPFLKAYKQPDEPCEKEMMPAFDFDFELYSLSTDEYKTLIYDEI